MTDPITADLPAPRDDEPTSLRQDIVDELRDHLECALVRELHNPHSRGCISADQTTHDAARHRVLTRFGNPASIARRLWWDALQEKIMSQRLMLAASVAMAVACCAMFVLIKRSVDAQQAFFNQQQQNTQALLLQFKEDADRAARERQDQFEQLLAQSQQSSRELATQAAHSAALAQQSLDESRAAQAKLTERIAAIETEPEAPSDWNPVELTFVQGTENGPPAAGFAGYLRMTTPETGIPPVDATSDEKGILRFERVRYGIYELQLSAPWKEYYGRTISIQPGESYAATIVCPPAAPEPLELAVSVNWPEDLARRPIWMSLSSEPPYREFGGVKWTTRATHFFGTFGSRSRGGFGTSSSDVLVSPTGEFHFGSSFRGFTARGNEIEQLRARLFRNTLVEKRNGDQASILMRWPGRDYQLHDVEFYVLSSPRDHQHFAAGEPLREDASIAHVSGADLGAETVNMRLEEGPPARLIVVPTEAAVTAMRSAFALIDQAVAGGNLDVSYSFDDDPRSGFGGRISRLPPVVTPGEP
jgi:hypothetical protein